VQIGAGGWVHTLPGGGASGTVIGQYRVQYWALHSASENARPTAKDVSCNRCWINAGSLVPAAATISGRQGPLASVGGAASVAQVQGLVPHQHALAVPSGDKQLAARRLSG